MKVIGAGFGRTGTASLAEALERLGFGPCHHMFDVVGEPWRMRDWITAAEGGDVDWDAVFRGYESTIDWPSAAFWAELAAHFPAAKVILTVRDPEKWYDSASNTIFKNALRRRGPVGRAGLAVLRRFSPPFATFLRMTDAAILSRVFDGRLADRAHAVATFTRHVEDVKSRVEADRLLVFDVAEGWEPLCAFLGVPVPDSPFPRGNDTAAFHREDRRRMSRLILSR
ncbi:sulfotransferase family protein [Amycolatopsis thailandensis]|uniref:sulfotransferase family protein n=1 Tax=Amycolatopsis thailandensis TaxID=589330 RepID=UPI00364D9B2C